MKTNRESGSNYSTVPPSPTLPFGRHRGVPLPQVPTPYLVWLIGNAKLSSRLRALVAAELAGRGLPAPCAPPPPAACQRCGPVETRCTWQEDSAGRKRIRRPCAKCGRYLQFVPTTEPFITEADRNASDAPTIAALVQAEIEGCTLACDGSRVYVVESYHRASVRLRELIRQQEPLLASLLRSERKG